MKQIKLITSLNGVDEEREGRGEEKKNKEAEVEERVVEEVEEGVEEELLKESAQAKGRKRKVVCLAPIRERGEDKMRKYTYK